MRYFDRSVLDDAQFCVSFKTGSLSQSLSQSRFANLLFSISGSEFLRCQYKFRIFYLFLRGESGSRLFGFWVLGFGFWRFREADQGSPDMQSVFALLLAESVCRQQEIRVCHRLLTTAYIACSLTHHILYHMFSHSPQLISQALSLTTSYITCSLYHHSLYAMELCTVSTALMTTCLIITVMMMHRIMIPKISIGYPGNGMQETITHSI